jgi:hypothetical protein
MAALVFGFVLVTLSALFGMTFLYIQASWARAQAEKDRHCATTAWRTAEINHLKAEQVAQEAKESEQRLRALNELLVRELLAEMVQADRFRVGLTIRIGLHLQQRHLEATTLLLCPFSLREQVNAIMKQQRWQELQLHWRSPRETKE